MTLVEVKTEVKRWALDVDCLYPSNDGEWCEYGDHLAALSAVTAERDALAARLGEWERSTLARIMRENVELTTERDRLREDRDSQQRVCIAEMEKVSQLRAEVEVMRAQRDKMAQILRDLVPGCKWRFMRPRIDQALQEVDGGN